jgi:hypothetical protein
MASGKITLIQVFAAKTPIYCFNMLLQEIEEKDLLL